ncbi:IMP dehydrogenase [Candidatus Woesearchaeota archaeon]|jgi:IMP dehydrogenase|nr:IMP dehydrogenase [Candidatus Woesearchaeota archaeon]|tara:strand:+ start:199 stop:1614 length:1416 start_codon:yes stop_codon:yes gene_type:complete
MKLRYGLTFDDVLLVPKKSSVNSRKEINVSSKLTKKIILNNPLVSANMDTVTESEMAIAMARKGGIGIIHRFLSLENQVSEVLKVKRSESFIIEDPYTFSQEKTILEAKAFMKEFNVGGLLIINRKNNLTGILSRRDVLFANDKQLVIEVMTKNSDMITINKKISIQKARKILHKYRIEKLPIVDDKGKIKGLITSEDIRKAYEYPLALKDEKGRLIVGAAVGVKKGFLERAIALKKAGVDVLVVDIAHGHSNLAINAVKEIKKNLDVEVIAGNVATAKGVKDLITAGADAVKVGIGPGSICITRLVAGAGVPQLTALFDCAKEAKKKGIPIIADGGIRTSGDLTKALAVGASSVMCGNLFAGTDEAPGVTILRNGTKYKVSRGMASFGAALGRKLRTGTDTTENVAEGVEAIVPYKGRADEIIAQLIGGLRSGMSYCGSSNIKELQKNAEFIRITPASMKESKPHNIEKL